jgi:hypothetical protein
MEFTCDFHSYAPQISCSRSYGKYEGTFKLTDCNDNDHVINHLQNINVFDRNILVDEKTLILLRSGIIQDDSFDSSSKIICIKHRKTLGIDWKQPKNCCNPNHSLISKKSVCQWRINYSKACSILKLSKFNLITPSYATYLFGSLICKDCSDSLEEVLKKFSIVLSHISSLGNIF